MATIDDLGIQVHSLYAIRTTLAEETYKEFRLQEAASIPPQTTLFDTFPKMTNMSAVVGEVPVTTWAFFFAPKGFYQTRRSPFAFYRIAPSLGSLEKQDEDEALIASIPVMTEEEKQEKEAVLQLIDVVRKVNDWINFIWARVGQFLQG